MARADAPDDTTVSILRAFSILYEPEILARARNIVGARRVIVGEDFTSHATDAELTDAAISSCAAALVDVIVARALLARRSAR